MRPLPFPSIARAVALTLLLFAVAGCSVLGGTQRDPVTLYSPQQSAQADPSWPQVGWQLAIARPSAARLVDSPRIAVRPVPGELQVYRGSAWAQPPTDMLEAGVLRVLEDSGKIAGVGRLASGMRSDYRLLMDVRRFEADYRGGAQPAATIEVSATLLDSRDQRIVARRTFERVQPAGATDVASVAHAFDQALASISAEIAGWTLAQGQGDASARR
jgi:cholesterol transport system auxiliary component